MSNSRPFISIILLFAFFSSNLLFAQSKKTVIKFLERSLRNSYLTVYRQSFNQSENDKILPDTFKVSSDGLCRIVFFADSPFILRANDIFLNDYPYLVELEDSITINNDNGQLEIEGNGSEKYRITYEAWKLHAMLEQLMIEYHYPSTRSSFLSTFNLVTNSMKVIDDLVSLNSDHITNLARKFINSAVKSEVEYAGIRAFSRLHAARGVLKISNAELCSLYDSTIRKSPTIDAALDDSLGFSSFPIATGYNVFEYRRSKDFAISAKSNMAQVYLGYYNLARNKYNDLLRDEILYRIVTSYLIRDIGFTEETEMALKDFYSSAKSEVLKAELRKFELRKRTLSTGDRAPDFNLTDLEGSIVKLSDFRGKIVVLGFWHSACKDREQISKGLKKAQLYFKENDQVVFLNISTDKYKATWRKSLSAGKFGNMKAKNIYTNGQGESHPVIKQYDILKYPTLLLIDDNGRILTNEISYPGKDDGKRLIALIENRIRINSDGPYILYKGVDRVHKSLVLTSKGVQVDSSVFKIGAKNSFTVATGEPGESFLVNLHEKLEKEPTFYEKPEKIMVLSDIEGNFSAFRNLLQSNGVINDNFEWVFGNGHLVIAGDVFDRGLRVTECLWLIYSLETKAEALGGKVHFILGNHEIMNLSGDIRYLNEKYKNTLELIDEDYASLFGQNSEIGRWLRTKNIVEKIGDILFIHGGISPEINALKFEPDEMNELARAHYAKRDSLKSEGNTPEMSLLFSTKISPFWYRDYYKKRGVDISVVQATLNKFDVNRIITGHTIVADSITTHYDKKVINVDTPHAAGKSEALLIEGTKYYRVNAEGHRWLLFSE